MGGRTRRKPKQERRKAQAAAQAAQVVATPRSLEPDRPKRNWRARILVVLAVTVASLGLGEVIIRGSALAPGIRPIETQGADTVYKRSSNPLLGFEIKAGYRNDQANLIKSYPSTNSHGQRDVERTVATPPGVRRILLLGDSVVEGVGIEALSDTMPLQLQQAYANGRTEVLNFGVSGYCTLAEVELLEVKGLRFSPDVVVLVFVENDFENFNREAFQLGATMDRPRLVEALFVHSHLARLAFLQLNLFQFAAQRDPVSWNANAIGENNVVEGLRRFHGLALKHGFAPLIAIWPGFTETSVVDLQTMPSDPDHLVVERIAEGLGLPTVRLSGFFEQDRIARGHPVNPKRLYTIGDGLHPSVEGCRVGAAALKEAIEGLLSAEGGYVSLRPSGDDIDMAAIKVAKMRGSAKPNYAVVHADTGLTLQSQGQLEEAIAQYRRSIQEQPTYALAHYHLGNALVELGELDDAVKAYREAIRLKPGYAIAYNNLARVFSTQGKLDEAARHYRRAARIDPTHIEALSNLGTILESQGALEQAAKQYRKALDLQPGYVEVRFNLANVLLRLDQVESAEGEYRRTIGDQPDYGKGYYGLAVALQMQGHTDDAIKNLEKALQLSPELDEARVMLERLRGLGQ